VTIREIIMPYRVYSGPRGSEFSPADKQHLLYKECSSLDEAFAWARHVDRTGRTPLLIEGEDGTSLSKQEIAAAIGVSLGG
jgi:hypothetical protein